MNYSDDIGVLGHKGFKLFDGRKRLRRAACLTVLRVWLRSVCGNILYHSKGRS